MSMFNVGDYIKSPKKDVVFYVKEKLDDHYVITLINKGVANDADLPPDQKEIGLYLTTDEEVIGKYRKVKPIFIEE